MAGAEWTPDPAPDLGAVVARVGQVPIYSTQVLAEAKREGKSPRQALDDLVAANLLAERARQAGMRPPPPRETDVESALVQRLLERELEPSLRAEAMPDSVLRPLYDRAKAAFVHPRRVEIGMLAVYTGARMDDARRGKRQKAATDLAAWLKAHPPATLEDFAAIGREPEWQARGVVYDRFLQSSAEPIGGKVGQAMAKLHTVGETTSLLADDDGFYIARYISEQAPETITFEQARGKLKAAYLETWRQQRFLEFTGRLMQGHRIEAHLDRLSLKEQGP
jgi:hypothetical protein